MTSTAAAPPPPRAYRRLSVEERRAQLLVAALGLFAHRAPDEVSLDEVAVAAGVSRPLVYRYFPGGRQQLYEAALGSAADELKLCFTEPPAGPPTERVARVLDRYLRFVDEHDTGFSALLRGGSVVETSRTTTIVDGVRRAAAEEILSHLGRIGGSGPQSAGPRSAGPRLRMMVRSWIAAVEAASLIWLDEGKQPSAAELRGWLVDHLIALLAATAATDEETASVLTDLLVLETPGGPAGRLAELVIPVVAEAAHLLPHATAAD
ncbi:TetR/AcrR family transcriptional regulator [Streptomyces sp. ISL-112]|uniref:TetR/AcrR family transcriptional regulator n=1 Tax=unclassified Streptomyces TaxID=2593676 RepID=UPI001BEAC279|nr:MULTISPECIES: TetR/AcrR family transcriptional regulator [unclassified Streptomyces]MBT2428693.1 TetR/AcrR family transcriptional regulator [Streptomyces sp. ISL-112]MBT2461109.1 TetR/AcrR family transcriptional regulator [Streptomyces sp. ISL-63]